jgi:hypothetical protein
MNYCHFQTGHFGTSDTTYPQQYFEYNHSGVYF